MSAMAKTEREQRDYIKYIDNGTTPNDGSLFSEAGNRDDRCACAAHFQAITSRGGASVTFLIAEEHEAAAR